MAILNAFIVLPVLLVFWFFKFILFIMRIIGLSMIFKTLGQKPYVAIVPCAASYYLGEALGLPNYGNMLAFRDAVCWLTLNWFFDAAFFSYLLCASIDEMITFLISPTSLVGFITICVGMVLRFILSERLSRGFGHTTLYAVALTLCPSIFLLLVQRKQEHIFNREKMICSENIFSINRPS
ncbi:hypothetical protein [Atopobium fossor]|uniref:hypothetical protein n=1 Tax=Atopobium fossor TaxID=39487 RepID=UPI00041CC775|nr:hypothetical protein [Atopobium fossor]